MCVKHIFKKDVQSGEVEREKNNGLIEGWEIPSLDEILKQECITNTHFLTPISL